MLPNFGLGRRRETVAAAAAAAAADIASESSRGQRVGEQEKVREEEERAESLAWLAGKNASAVSIAEFRVNWSQIAIRSLLLPSPNHNPLQPDFIMVRPPCTPLPKTPTSCPTSPPHLPPSPSRTHTHTLSLLTLAFLTLSLPLLFARPFWTSSSDPPPPPAHPLHPTVFFPPHLKKTHDSSRFAREQASSKQIPDKDHLDVKRRQVSSFFRLLISLPTDAFLKGPPPFLSNALAESPCALCISQMIDSFVQVGQAMRTCADTVQAFADASALANPTDIGSLLSILAAGHSLATNISGSAPSAGGLEQSFEEDAKDKKKRKRALKDPNAPKRPVTAYLQFQNEVKNEVQDQHRDKSYKDILRLVAEKWKGLDDGIKNVSSSLSHPLPPSQSPTKVT